MMNAKCHNCGREYLVARKLAGTTVACRSCGALNDGAGGAPPPPAAKSQPRSSGGAAFTVGTPLPKTDRRSIDREIEAEKEAIGDMPDPARTTLMNRTVLALGIGAAVLACVIVGSLFVVRYIEQNPDGSRAWTSEMLATPQLFSSDGSGSGFVVEINDELWLVTNFHVIDGSGDEIDIVFPDPETGKEIFRVADQKVDQFRLHRHFLDTYTSQTDGMHYDIAALRVEKFRFALEGLGVVPLEMLPSSRVRAGQNVFAIGHPGTDFEFVDETDTRSANTARHTLTAGLLSAVRRTDSRPTVVQSDAAINHGNSGGPLLNFDGDVVAVNTWKDIEMKAGGGYETRQGMSFGLATEHVYEVIRDGISYEDVVKQIAMLAALGGSSPTGPNGAPEEESWATFDKLKPAIVASVVEGWGAASAHTVRTTDLGGRFPAEYKVQTPGPVDLYIVVLPQSPQVDIDLATVKTADGTVVGDDRRSVNGDVAELKAFNVTHGGSISIDVRTFLNGKSVPARFAILVFERPARGGPPAPPAPGTP